MDQKGDHTLSKSINSVCLGQTTRVSTVFADRIMPAISALRCDKTGMTDGAILTDDGCVFPVHRAVLSASSGYFRGLYCSPLSVGENKDPPSNVLLPDASSCAVSAIIEFAYTGVMNPQPEDEEEVLILADRLIMPHAVRYCGKLIFSKINRKNCVRIYLLSLRCYCPDLQTRAREYLLRRPPHTWSRSDAFDELTPEDLLELLSDDELNTREEEDVLRLIIKWISISPATHESYLPMLASAVRLGLCSKSFLTHMIEMNTFIQKNESLLERFKHVAELLEKEPDDRIIPPESLQWFKPRLPPGVILCIGGWKESGVSCGIDIYNPRTNRWMNTEFEDIGYPKASHGVVKMGRMIYCFGGFDGRYVIATVRAFDCVNLCWLPAASMHAARCHAACSAWKSCILVAGGYDGRLRLKTCEMYDTVTNTWNSVTPMNEERSDGSAATYGDAIFVAGGFNGRRVLNSVEMYLPEQDRWTEVTRMTNCRSGLRFLRHKSLIIAVGGFDGARRLANVDSYDPRNNTWATVAKLKTPRSNCLAAIIDGELYVAGGYCTDNQPDNTAELVLLYSEDSSPRRQKTPRNIESPPGVLTAASACVLDGPGLSRLLDGS